MSPGGWTRLLVGSVVCCSLAACGGNNKKASTKSAIKIGSDIEYAPIEFFKEGTQHIQKLDDLCGKPVAVQKGTTQDTDIRTPQEAKCRAAGKPISVLRFEKDPDALQQVKNGRAVADLEDFPVAAYNAQTSGGGADF